MADECLTAAERELLAFLLPKLTPRRRERFEGVLAQRTRRITVLLENVRQTHNYSAVLRSCEAFGVQDVHLVDEKEQFAVNKDVALGADKWLTTRRHESTAGAVASLQAAGYRVLATSPHGESERASEVDVSRPVALLFGCELTGISEEGLAACDGRVRIPMHGFTESFNVSVAAALCLYDLTTRLRRTGGWGLSDEVKDVLRLAWCRKSIRKIDVVEAEWNAARSVV